MVTATRVDAGTRRQMILEVAARLFHARPYAEVTTKAIAAEAGVSEALVFQHFATKQALYSAAVQLDVEGVTEQLRTIVLSALELPEATAAGLEQLFAGSLEVLFADPALLASFLLEPSGEDVRRTYYQVLLDQEQAMLPALERARAAGLLPDVDPRVLLRALIGQTLVFVVTEAWFGGAELGPVDRSTLPRDLARLWASALRPDEPARSRRSR